MTITIDGKQMRIDGTKLRRLRERRFLSRDELAQKSGVHRDSIGRIERGAWTGGSQLPTIRRLAEALEVSPQEIVFSEDLED